METKSISRGGMTLIVIAFYGLLAAGSGPAGPSVSQVKVLQHSAEDHIYTDSESNPDYGKRVKVFIRNDGPASSITLSVILSSSQGRWKKRATTKLESDEVGTVYLDFPEPNFGAGDIMVSKIEIEAVE